eukprot:c23411_g3_i1 orf=244-2328(-)
MALLEHDKEASPKVVGSSASFHDRDGADQLVYQLVRVEEDGTVVPASEDEVIEMESYLEEGAAIQVSDAEGTQLDMTDEEATVCEQEESTVSKHKDSVGSQSLDGLEAEKKKILAQLAFLDALLQKLKKEEQERASLEAADHVTGYSKLTRSQSVAKQATLATMDLDGRWDSKSDTNIMSSDISDDFCQKQAVIVQQNTDSNKSKSRELESPSSTSKHNWTSTSNESLFKENSAGIGLAEDKRETSRDSDGDVFKGNSNLDKLSIRELHEAYRTTFGRQTSVKDKQWLKRRISRGLGGSLEVTSAEDGLDESSMFSFMDGTPGFIKPRQGAESRSLDAPLPSSLGSESLDHNKIAEKILPEATTASLLDRSSFDHSQQSPWVPHRPTITGGLENFVNKNKIQLSKEEGKRKRKPTKRYIEELAASATREVSGKVACMKEEKDDTNIPNKMHYKEQQKQTAASTLGISKVKFRTGYRKRRGGTNKSGNKGLTSSSSERAAQLVRKAISLRTSRVSGKAVLTESRVKIKSLPDDLSDDASDSSIPSSNHEAEPVSNLPELNSPEGDTDALVNAKARIQKKHHHPWTLREVVKLLEGVTHCGVGKWADIKKYSFSSSVNRSSTDLKDKWRNLVRASNTHYKMVAQGERHRKHSASPVPGHILVQVYELTKQRGHHLSVHAVSGMSRSGRSVLKKQLN